MPALGVPPLNAAGHRESAVPGGNSRGLPGPVELPPGRSAPPGPRHPKALLLDPALAVRRKPALIAAGCAD